MKLTYATPQHLQLESDSDTNSDLRLVSTGSNLTVAVSNCTSGYSLSSTAITSGVVNLYKGDQNCLVKLTGFTLGSVSYTPTGGTDFTTWLNNDVATFKNTAGSDTIKVFVSSQVTQSGVQTSDTIVYKFTDVSQNSTSSLSQSTTSTPVPLIVSGQAAPNFTVTQSRYLSTNPNGSANMAFTLQCGTTMSGSSLATYACSSILLNSQLDYILIPDSYSQGAITVAQATSAFSSNTATSVGSLIVSPGGTDLHSNTLSNGGFYTSETTPLVTGSLTVYPNNLNSVFILRSKDLSGNVLAYLYFYVDIASISQTPATVSGCGTTFSGGSGTVGDPYLIYSSTDFSHVASCSSSSTYFKQMTNINLAGSTWTPFVLYGQYDGNNYQISGLTISGSTSSSHIGLFADLNTNSSVSNLTISGVNMTLTPSQNQPAAGALTGQVNPGATVTNVSASGSITLTNPSGSSNAWLGGLVGIVQGSVISSSSSVNVTMNPNTFTQNGGVGGLIGFVVSNGGSCVVSNSYATGTVSTPGGTFSGGSSPYGSGSLIAYIFGGFGSNTISITNSYGLGNQTLGITSPNTSHVITIGGIAGFATMTRVTISGSFSSGSYSITSNNNMNVKMGGLVGAFNGTTTGVITNSYSNSTLSVSGTHAASTGVLGGFVGNAGGSAGAVSISSSYAANPSISGTGVNYNQGFIGLESAVPTVSTSYYYYNASTPSNVYTTGVTSYTTTTQMQTQSNFSSLNFSTPIWRMPAYNPISPSGLLSPVLNWQCGTNGITCN